MTASTEISTKVNFKLSSCRIDSELMNKLGIIFSVDNHRLFFECILNKLRECYYGEYPCHEFIDLVVEPGNYTRVETDRCIHEILNEPSRYETSFISEIDILTYLWDSKMVTLVSLPIDVLFHPNSYPDLLSALQSVISEQKLEVYKVVFIVTESQTRVAEVEMLEVYGQ